MTGTHIYIKFAKAKASYIWQKNIIKRVVEKAIAHLVKN